MILREKERGQRKQNIMEKMMKAKALIMYRYQMENSPLQNEFSKNWAANELFKWSYINV